jgi:hypothetical protein
LLAGDRRKTRLVPEAGQTRGREKLVGVMLKAECLSLSKLPGVLELGSAKRVVEGPGSLKCVEPRALGEADPCADLGSAAFVLPTDLTLSLRRMDGPASQADFTLGPCDGI